MVRYDGVVNGAACVTPSRDHIEDVIQFVHRRMSILPMRKRMA